MTRPLLWLGLCLSVACQRQSAEPAQPTPATSSASAASPVTQQASSAAQQASPGDQAELLAIGAPIPQVSAVTHTGERFALAEARGKPLVVYFYPKDDTPGCTVEALEIRDLWQEIQSTSAVVVGVSTDDAESHKAFAEKHALPFVLLPDTDQSILRAFGVPTRSGRASRVSFVFDRDGKLVKVFPKVTPKGHGGELLATLKSLG